jgi:hypothetical protein
MDCWAVTDGAVTQIVVHVHSMIVRAAVCCPTHFPRIKLARLIHAV